MLKALVISLIAVLVHATPAWACSCGGKLTSVSEFLKTVTVVYGTPQKTEWLGYHIPTPVADENWWKNHHKRTQTTLVDVEYLSGDKQSVLSFYHNPDGASCGIRPRMGGTAWFVLSDDEDGDLGYFHCTASRIPFGAILDYHLTGADPVVPSRTMCYFQEKQRSSSAAYNVKTPAPDEACAFWDEDNQRRLNKIWREHRRQILNRQNKTKTK